VAGAGYHGGEGKGACSVGRLQQPLPERFDDSAAAGMDLELGVDIPGVQDTTLAVRGRRGADVLLV
jgi:hypothetical protein